MSLTKRSLIVRGTCSPLIAVGTILLGLGQPAGQPPSQLSDPREASHSPMRPIEATQATDGQPNAEQLPRFNETLQAADELAAALSIAHEKFEALAGATKTAVTELYWRLGATRRQRDELSAALVDMQGKLRAREVREKELAGHVVALGEEARQLEADLAGLRLGLEASEQRRQQLEAVGNEVAQLKGELLSLDHPLETANAALGQAQEERDAARAETQALRAEIAALLNTALASLQQKVGDSKGAPSTGLTPRGNFVDAPIPRPSETQDRREAGL
jgi:chromosome segregation ATPase